MCQCTDRLLGLVDARKSVPDYDDVSKSSSSHRRILRFRRHRRLRGHELFGPQGSCAVHATVHFLSLANKFGGVEGDFLLCNYAAG